MKIKKIKVKKVIDGDTFEGSRKKFYRLAGIDTPEKRSRGFNKAKEILKDMIEGKEVFVEEKGQSYGRKVVVARVQRTKMTVNERMKRRGYKSKKKPKN